MRKPSKNLKNVKGANKVRRKLSSRKKISGTADKPRICVSKSVGNLYVQVIDDELGKTLVSAKTFGKKSSIVLANVEGAKALGVEIATSLKKLGIARAVFDRSGSRYSGAVLALADSIRSNGIIV